MPNVTLADSAIITDNTTLAETLFTSATVIDPVDALSCSELVGGPAGVNVAGGGVTLNCELGFFYLKLGAVIIGTDDGRRIKLRMEDDATPYTMAD